MGVRVLHVPSLEICLFWALRPPHLGRRCPQQLHASAFHLTPRVPPSLSLLGKNILDHHVSRVSQAYLLPCTHDL